MKDNLKLTRKFKKNINWNDEALRIIERALRNIRYLQDYRKM